MNFEQFKNNVEKWAEERGIYEHSTPDAQLLKTLSELGELADAIIKGDREGLKDAIGDVAVCIINYAYMNKIKIDSGYLDTCTDKDLTPLNMLGFIYRGAGNELSGEHQQYWHFIPKKKLAYLYGISNAFNLDFMDCCESAWNEIKDRKGKMVAGGAFVKEEDIV